MLNYYKIQINNINYHVYYAINSQNNFWEYKENNTGLNYSWSLIENKITTWEKKDLYYFYKNKFANIFVVVKETI